MFASLDVENKGFLEPKDFRDIFGKKTARAFLVFDVGLNGTLDVMQFTTAIDEIYFSRQRVWDSYTDRRKWVTHPIRSIVHSFFVY